MAILANPRRYASRAEACQPPGGLLRYWASEAADPPRLPERPIRPQKFSFVPCQDMSPGCFT
jgi:hypothetical protein